MKKTKLAGIVLWLLGICLYFYPDVATDLQEIKVQAFVKTYEREHKSRRRSVTGSRQELYHCSAPGIPGKALFPGY